MSVLECVTNESKPPYDFTSSCSNQLFLCNQIRKINTLLLIHFLILTLTGQYSSIRPLLFLLPLTPPPKSEQSFLNARFRWFKKIKQNNKPNHIALLKCPSVVRKMPKSLAWLAGICLPSLSSHTDFSELLTHQPFLMSLDVTCSYLCSWLELLCIYTFAWTTPVYL